MATPVRIREVRQPDDPAIAKGHQLLQRTFHKAELVGRAEWRTSLQERQAGLWTDIRWHLVVAERGSTVVGVASGLYLGNINSGTIGYLAVSAAARGLGVGPKLRARLRALFRRDAEQIARQPLRAIVGEVRRDNPWLRTLIRRERVLALDFEYFQPRLRRGAKAVPLVLYYESFGRPRHRLSTAFLRKLLYTTWRRAYRIARPMSDGAFKRMLAGLAGRTSIGEIAEDQLRPRPVAPGSRSPRSGHSPGRS